MNHKQIYEVEETIRRHLGILEIKDADGITHDIMNKLFDANVFGLRDNETRTTCSTKLALELGKLTGCKHNEDADDILKAAIEYAKTYNVGAIVR